MNSNEDRVLLLERVARAIAPHVGAGVAFDDLPKTQKDCREYNEQVGVDPIDCREDIYRAAQGAILEIVGFLREEEMDGNNTEEN